MPDNDTAHVAPTWRSTEASGQAALILVESLLHGLLEQSLLTMQQSLEIVSSAIDVQTIFAEQEAVDTGKMHQARQLLIQIAKSLEIDL